MDSVVLGGGCFWCLEAVFLRVRGVAGVVSGYANGQTEAPTYEQVCSGRSGHAEVVEVRFDPQQLSLDEVLMVFFAMHDPTTLNRQGNDVGTQYRSGVYTHSEAQARAVRAFMATMPHDAHWENREVVTEVQALSKLWPAEQYHQTYFDRNPQQGYCAYIIAPKVQKLMRDFTEYLAR
jgi:peptide-methionine (S)-S-oxide reductase